MKKDERRKSGRRRCGWKDIGEQIAKVWLARLVFLFIGMWFINAYVVAWLFPVFETWAVSCESSISRRGVFLFVFAIYSFVLFFAPINIEPNKLSMAKEVSE